jgi:hypothetical protein
MKPVGRITVRENKQVDGGSKDDLILGHVFPGAKLLKSGRIYQIFEFDGTFILQDVGPSAIKSRPDQINLSWANDVHSIIYDGRHLLTEAEIDELD